MTSDAPDGWQARVERALGPIESRRPLGGRAWAVTARGRRWVVKTGPGVADEAEGLCRLAGALADLHAGPPVPEVALADRDLLVTAWVDQGERTPAHEESLGRQLAALHATPTLSWGGGSSWIGAAPVDPTEWPDAASFYGARLLDLAARCGMTGAVAPVVERLDRLLPDGGPALLHGDLWWGNVLWGADGRPWLIDPSVHGGHPEEDLAMLGLFGAVPGRTRAAYDEVSPPGPGRAERVGLFTLVPLLVHTVLFGGTYRAELAATLEGLPR